MIEWGQLYRNESAGLIGYAMRRGLGRVEAEDAVSEAFCEAIRLDVTPHTPLSWLRHLVGFQVLKARERRRREGQLLARLRPAVVRSGGELYEPDGDVAIVPCGTMLVCVQCGAGFIRQRKGFSRVTCSQACSAVYRARRTSEGIRAKPPERRRRERAPDGRFVRRVPAAA